MEAVAACDDTLQAPLAPLADHGVSTLHVAEGDVFASYAPQAIAEAIVELAGRLDATAVVGPGTERGNEVMAHAAASSTCRSRPTASPPRRPRAAPT